MPDCTTRVAGQSDRHHCRRRRRPADGVGAGAGEYRRWAPEVSVLHEAFRRGFGEAREWLPARVKREVVSYLRCGDVRYGFVEVTCDGCRDSRLVAFSCKGRGWCPSCTTRRAIETGVVVASRVTPPPLESAARLLMQER